MQSRDDFPEEIYALIGRMVARHDFKQVRIDDSNNFDIVVVYLFMQKVCLRITRERESWWFDIVDPMGEFRPVFDMSLHDVAMESGQEYVVDRGLAAKCQSVLSLLPAAERLTEQRRARLEVDGDEGRLSQ